MPLVPWSHLSLSMQGLGRPEELHRPHAGRSPPSLRRTPSLAASATGALTPVPVLDHPLCHWDLDAEPDAVWGPFPGWWGRGWLWGSLW